MKKILLLILTVISVEVSAQTFEWVKTFGSTGDDEGYKCAVDANGDLLFTGMFSQSIDWGTISLQSVGKREMYLIKCDKDGKALWGVQAGGDVDNSTYGRAIATDADNNVYVGGTFTGTLHIEGQQFVAVNDEGDSFSDCYIAKYDSDGIFQWVKVFAGVGGDVIEEMNVFGNQLFVVGSYKGSFDILGNAFTSDDPNTQSSYNPFIASLSLDGDLNWLNKVNCTSGTCRGFDIDNEGDMNVLLEMKGSIVIKNVLTGEQSPLKQSNATQDNYIAKLKGSDGSLMWGNRIGGAGFLMGYAVETDGDANVYCGGLFQGELKFESLDGNYQKVNATGKFDYYVCKYSKEGALLWSDAQGGSANDGVCDITVNANGSLYLAAYFTDPETVINGETYTCADGNEALLIKYDKQGTICWVKQTATSANSGYIYSMEMTSKDSIIMLGHYRGEGTFFNNQTYSNVDESKNIWIALMADPEEEPNGVEVIGNGTFDIYPVPADQYLNIKSNGPDKQITGVGIYNILGELIYKSNAKPSEIDITNIPSGVYFIQIETAENKITQQIVIQH